MANQQTKPTTAGQVELAEELRDKELDAAGGGLNFTKITYNIAVMAPERKPAEF